MLWNYSTKDCLSKFTMKNNIKTPQRWNEYKYKVHLNTWLSGRGRVWGTLTLQQWFFFPPQSRVKWDQQPASTSSVSIVFIQVGKPKHRTLIFNCPCSHEDGMQKSLCGHSSSGWNKHTIPGDEQEKFQWGPWVSQERFKLAYKLIRAVINCEQPLPYQEKHLSP